MSEKSEKESVRGLLVEKTAEEVDQVGAAPVVRRVEEEGVFYPTKEQRKIKSIFLSRIKGMGLILRNIDIDEVMLYAEEYPALRNYWTNPLFRSWFQNDMEERSRIGYLIHKQLDNIEDILSNEQGLYKANEMLAAGKQLMDLKNMFDKQDAPDKNEESEAIMVQRVAQQMLEMKNKKEKEGMRIVSRPELPV